MMVRTVLLPAAERAAGQREPLMRARRRAGHLVSALAAPVMLAGVLIATPGGAAAASCVSWTGIQPPNPGSAYDDLEGVATLSPCNAWAVGSYSNGTEDNDQTLILHWNGSSWRQVASPDPGGSGENDLFGITAVTANNIWAVGRYVTRTAQTQTLVLHWNGSSWKQIASPNPGQVAESSHELKAVRASSARNIWAVGDYSVGTGAPIHTLIEHWNGTAWKQVASPNPDPSESVLHGVATISPGNAWAVGSYGNTALILHWNGRAWKRMPSHAPGPIADLSGVAAVSSRSIWAVGIYFSAAQARTLVLHWNGRAWKKVTSPDPGGSARRDYLFGVTAVSVTRAWAVGTQINGTAGGQQTLVLRWNGRKWEHVASPDPGSEDSLTAVAASAAANLWAVGHDSTGRWQTLALHCC